jgi:HAD superfamily hydrolase (TIGR01490 family)
MWNSKENQNHKPKKKIALFDMDNTILSIDSTVIYIKEIIKRCPRSLLHIPIVIFYTILRLFCLTSLTRLKEVFYQPLKYLSVEERDSFAERIAGKSLAFAKEGAIKHIAQLKKEDYTLMIASASPEYYIGKISHRLGFDHFVGTRLVFDDMKVRIDGKNCKHVEKVRRIKEAIDMDEYDLDNSVAYSDTKSDIPMLKLVGNGYLIHPIKWELDNKID